LGLIFVKKLRSFCKELPAIWIVVFVYQVITIVLIAYHNPVYFVSLPFILSRTILFTYFIFRFRLKKTAFGSYISFGDTLIIYLLLSVFYGETGQLNSVFFAQIDPWLSNLDQRIFGFQPSILFSSHFKHPFFSEIMFLGYFSYYLMPFFAFLFIWVYKRQYFEKFSFYILSCFFTYYLIFIILPAAGPQFYFQAPLNQIPAQGPFGYIIKLIQKNGEAPTAAFPSSHIGISVIMLFLLFKYYKSIFKIYLPFVLILFFSTVYIKAHYFVDIAGGLISAPIVFIFNRYFYQSKLNRELRTSNLEHKT
jgi:membrane-associated phospholipid phosphatase